MSKRRKGWFRKAKLKFIRERVFSYEVGYGSFSVEDVASNSYSTFKFVGINMHHFQNDIQKISGFENRFLFAEKLYKEQPDKFYFEYTLRKCF